MCRTPPGSWCELLLPVLDDRGVQGRLQRPRAQFGALTPQQLLEAGDDDAVISLAMDLVRTA